MLMILPAVPSLSQVKQGNNDSSPALSTRYACEDDWIEIMFIQESRVRIRNGALVDLSTNALQGVDLIVNSLAWHKWIRNIDVAEDLIDTWELNGERNTGQDLYNLNNIYRLQIPKGLDVWEISGRLADLPGIYMAIPVPKPTPLPSPPPGSFQSQQGYLNAATTGIEALWSWAQTGGTGTGVTICDLEYNWNYNHADVTKAVGSQINPNPLTDPGPGIVNINHGTNVIGELVADNNSWGTTGICYGAGLKTCGTVYAAGGGWNVSGAIGYAIAALSAGDVILLEQQWDYTGSGGYIPIEWWGSYSYSNPNQLNNVVYAAIATAVANGIHVVEAGGNGNYDTGTLQWFGNSGSVIVGAGGTINTSTNLKRIVPGTWGSSYGSRYNLQGWGETVVTTGGTYAGAGDLYSAEGANYYYSQSFAGTSSASPMIAGAIACVQGYHRANISTTPLTPSFMLSHLVSWGNAQVTPPAGIIGPRPNIKTAIQNLPTVTYDFGDAPEPTYPTLLTSNGAYHAITGLTMGSLIDAESTGQPGVNANGDDSNPPGADDEDGVTFTSSLTPGQTASLQITVSAPGFLNAWIDFDKMGWNGTTDFVFQNYSLTAGLNILSFTVPSNAMPGWTYARFRFSSVGGLLWYGLAPSGEVEDYHVWIEENQLFDFGDAPDPTYPTLLASGGARHVNTGLALGALIDTEQDGQPQAFALGDDSNPAGSDDEDGVIWNCNFMIGQINSIQVTANGTGFLNAWFDFNQDGDWAEAGEQVVVDLPMVAGTITIMVSVPANAVYGHTFARFRLSTTQGLSFTGLANDGEVEDYQVFIDEASAMDFGDAPDPTYQTLLASNGARHFNTQLAPLNLGTQIDYEMNGTPSISANGDDLDTPIDDEDGIVWNTQLIPGQNASITVTYTGSNGVFQGWIDYNADGDWMDSGEQVFSNMVFASSPVVLNFTVPATAIGGTTYARFRFSSAQNLPPDGCAPDGEVEDYQVTIVGQTAYDFGDAPDPTYETLLVSAGAQHLIGTLMMGALIDSEPDGQSDPQAMGDDNNPGGLDDEDGVTWDCPFTPGHPNTVHVTVNGNGFLNAWFDFNIDGDWSDTGEQALTNVSLSAGTTDLFITVPAGAPLGQTFARFRFASTPGLNYKGMASDGEVEDYALMIQPAILMEYGDAPDPTYPTLAASNGARHDNNLLFPLFLGTLVDLETDGQPNLIATGDDLNNSADEDGILWLTLLTPGSLASLSVTASAAGGSLQGWIDFNADGDWSDSGEQIFTNTALIAGPQVLNFTVPSGAISGNTFARFRFSSVQNLQPYGCAPDGEVEDYQVNIAMPNILDLGDTPDPGYPTLLINNGAAHIVDGITFLGATVDVESDGQPDPLALGDDNSGIPDDEDGVTFDWPLLPGSPAKLTVIASVTGLFNGWIDFDVDGTWTQANEHVFTDVLLAAGSNNLHFIVPSTALPGGTFARFRFSTISGLTFLGLASNGEVEDYNVVISHNPELKWSQLPDTTRPGLHAYDYFNAFGIHEWTTRADDWQCNGGRVTDIHWWGNYELNAARVERRGAGIHHFHLSIHADNPGGTCLPVDPELWGMDVLFSSLTELYTGDTNTEGSKIYRYDYVLPSSFPQVSGMRYWLDITAFSNNPNNPPIWRWQEAIRSSPPILCGAVEKTSPAPATWSTTFFPLTGLLTDMAFTITNQPDKTLNLRFLLEGLYKGSTSMVKVQNGSGNQFGGDTTDIFKLELHDASGYATILFSKDSLSVDTNGLASYAGIPYNMNGNYYVTVKHRNSVETVSSSPVSFTGSGVSYDFTTAASQAYGGNQITIGTDNAFYSGDVNQDGLVDTSDISMVANAAAIFTSGYVATDVTGDGSVDSGDMISVDNNSANFVTSMTPP